MTEIVGTRHGLHPRRDADDRVFLSGAVGKGEIMTQPGPYSLAGDGLCVGRDSGSPISRDDYLPPFAFQGGTIDRVVVDVQGDPFIDHEKEVHAWLSRD